MARVKNVSYLVRAAVESGVLKKSTHCQVCGKDPAESRTESWHTGTRHKKLVAHHWLGHKYPLEVWWVCYSCNTNLTGRHDGSLKNVTEAFYYVFRHIPINRIPEKYRHVRNMEMKTLASSRDESGYLPNGTG